MSGQELENRTRYLIVPLVQGEMPSVEQMDLGFPKITFEPFSPRSDERWIVPSSDYQGRWPVRAQPRSPRRIRGDVRAVIVQQSRLDLV